MAREIVGYIDRVPPEAMQALRCLHSASVGVYDVSRGTQSDVSALMNADTTMRNRGWQRVVWVRDGNSTVMIYAPNRARQDVEDMNLCIAVFDGNQLVCVSGRVDLDKAAAIATEKLPRHSVEL